MQYSQTHDEDLIPQHQNILKRKLSKDPLTSVSNTSDYFSIHDGSHQSLSSSCVTKEKERHYFSSSDIFSENSQPETLFISDCKIKSRLLEKFSTDKFVEPQTKYDNNNSIIEYLWSQKINENVHRKNSTEIFEEVIILKGGCTI